VEVRPWLYTIARNTSLNMLRERRQAAIVGTNPALVEVDPQTVVERSQELRATLAAIAELPERQRTALVLAEMHGLGHRQIASVLGVEPKQVKAYVFQARTHLLSDRAARAADCDAIREQLECSRGGSLLKATLRGHLRHCHGCRSYAARLARQRRRLGVWLPWQPLMQLRRRLAHGPLDGPLSRGEAAGASAGVSLAAGVQLTNGGSKALLAKLLAGMALLGHNATTPPAAPRHEIASRGSDTLRMTAPDLMPSARRLVHARRRRPLSLAPSTTRPTTPPTISVGIAGAPPPAVEHSTAINEAMPAPPGGSSDGTTPKEAPGQAKKAAPETPSEPNSHGKSAEAPGHQVASEAAATVDGEAGNSGEVPPGQQQERTHGDEAGGVSESAHGKSEAEHGKGPSGP
jgi:hypothetical protein